jgi:hypothetical protein
MKVRYRLAVSGTLRLEYSFPVRARVFTYEFEVDEHGVVTHLNATARVPDRAHWPIVEYTPNDSVKAHIKMSNPYFPFLRQDLHAASGVLSIFGVDEIPMNEVEEFWEPENEAEKESLKLFSFKIQTQPTSPATWPSVPFDLAARALLVAERSGNFDAALNLFRKGRIDIKLHHYIDAVLDFLFMVETTFANGKFRTAQVEAEYLDSADLKHLISQSISDPVLLANVRSNGRIEHDFERTYARKPPESVISHVVRLRGELHHHTSRKSGIWHPMDHIRFGADAYFLQQLCLGIAFLIINPTLFGDDAEGAFQAQEFEHAKAGTLKIHRK